MAGDLKRQIEVSVDASGVETGVSRAKRSLADLGSAAQTAGRQASDGLGFIGAGSDGAATTLDRGAKAIVKSIQQTIASFDAGGAASSRYFESIARQKGIDPAILKPYLDALDAAANKQAALANSGAIDKQLSDLRLQAKLQGESAQFATTYKLALQGATQAQLEEAAASSTQIEAYKARQKALDELQSGIKKVAVAAAAAGAALYLGINNIAEGISQYKDLSEQIGDSASAVASLQTAADTSGRSLDQAAGFSIKLTRALSQTDDESKRAGQALKAIGLNFDEFKQKSPVEQIEAVAKALKGFDDGPGKTAVLEALVRGSSQLLPFFNDLGDQQERQLRLTDEQIPRADEFTKAHARQASALKAVAQSIVAESLPAITALTGGIKDAITEIVGVSGSATKLGENKGIRDFAESAVLSIATIADGARDAINTLLALGSSAALLYETAKLGYSKLPKFSGPLDIFGVADSGPSKSDIEKSYREQSDATGAAVARMLGEDRKTFYSAVAERLKMNRELEATNLLDKPTRPKIDTSSLISDRAKKVNTGIDKAQLKSDIDEVEKAYARLNGIYQNSTQILEAQHAAGALSDSQYFEAKREMIRLEAAADEKRYQDEITRYQRESLIGKDAIENQRKIADARAAIERLQDSSATKLEVLSIQQEAAASKLAAAFVTARQAAQDYFDGVQKQQARELAGAGRGTQQRTFDSGINQIEDRYAGQRRDAENLREQLESENKFDENARAIYDNRLAQIQEFQSKSIASYAAYYAARLQQDRDAGLGAQEALQNYFDGAQKLGKQTEDLVTKSLGGIEDAFVSLATTGKLSFKSLVDSIASDIVRISVKSSIADLAKNLGLVAGEGGTGAGAAGAAGQAAALASSTAAQTSLSVATTASATSLAALTTASTAAATALAALSGTSSTAALAQQASGMDGDSLDNFIGLLGLGGRASGGPVSPGGLYRVNEKGPELLTVGSNTMLMMGSQGGSVSPAAGVASHRTINVTVNQNFPENTSRQTVAQAAAQAAAALRRSQRDT